MKSFYEFLNEATNPLVKWKKMGCVLILGTPDTNGKKFLYLARLRDLKTLARKTKNNKPAEPVNMAYLYSDIFRIRLENDKLVTRKIDYNLHTLYLALGIHSLAVGLNEDKTPLHWDSINNDISIKFLNDNIEYIKNIENIKFKNYND